MLVEFRIKNFRSLRDEQVLSLVASADKTMLDTHALGTGLKAVPHCRTNQFCISIGWCSS